jgi:hypothetical protein
MSINKIKKAFSFIRMQTPTGKAVHLCLILVIGVSLFSRHIISSSSGKALHLPQNQNFAKTDFSREGVIKGKAFSGEIMQDLAVLISVRWPKESEYPVLIKLDESQNLFSATKDTNSKCMIQGIGYTGSSNPATIDIDFTEVTCEVNGILETHKIDGKICNIAAETVPAAVAFKDKIQSLNDRLKNETDEESIELIKHYIKKIEVAGPALILPAHTQIQGRIIQKDDKVVIETLNN